MAQPVDQSPPQFRLKDAIVVTTALAAWLALYRNVDTRFYAWFALLLGVTYLAVVGTRLVRRIVQHLAERGRSAVYSASLAAMAGSTLFLAVVTCLRNMFAHFVEEPPLVFMFMIVFVGVYLFAGIVTLLILLVLAVFEPFRRDWRDLPTVAAGYLVAAVIGAALFLGYSFALFVVFEVPVADKLRPLVINGALGALVGTVFGSSALHMHLYVGKLLDAKAAGKALDPIAATNASRDEPNITS